MTFVAGQSLTASMINRALGVTVADTQNAIALTNVTGYSETFTSSNTPAAVVFTAPASGAVLIHNNAWLDHRDTGTARRTYLGWIIREGAVIGSGTVVQNAIDANAIHNNDIGEIQTGKVTLVTGLAPGEEYNVRQAGKVSTVAAVGSEGETQNRHLIVEPVI